MCRRVTCLTCGRPTFAGCGAHVEQVLAGVPPAERCQCETERPRTRDARQTGESIWQRVARAWRG